MGSAYPMLIARAPSSQPPSCSADAEQGDGGSVNGGEGGLKEADPVEHRATYIRFFGFVEFVVVVAEIILRESRRVQVRQPFLVLFGENEVRGSARCAEKARQIVEL